MKRIRIPVDSASRSPPAALSFVQFHKPLTGALPRAEVHGGIRAEKYHSLTQRDRHAL